MCNINKETKLKTKVVYKVVFKCSTTSRYFACFSGMEIKVGEVDKNYELNDEYYKSFDLGNGRFYFERYRIGSRFYNRNLIGKTSGFADKHWSEVLRDSYDYTPNVIVLKIKLGGDIMEGDALGLYDNIPNSARVYAGSKILSIKEC